MNWKDEIKELDVEKGDVSLALKAKTYNINGEILTIPDLNEYGNMLVSLSQKISYEMIKRNTDSLINALVKFLKPILETKASKEELDDLNNKLRSLVTENFDGIQWAKENIKTDIKIE